MAVQPNKYDDLIHDYLSHGWGYRIEDNKRYFFSPDGKSTEIYPMKYNQNVKPLYTSSNHLNREK